MYNGVTSVASWVSKNTLEARWGWHERERLDYFLTQEHGNKSGGARRPIMAMESIAISLFEAEDILKYKLGGLGRK